METSKNYNEIFLQLNNDEAVVLLNLLARINEGNNDAIFEDQAEQRIMWDMEAALEKVISSTFEKNYHEIIFNARKNIRDAED